jgi:hypothetical protein
MLPKEYDRKSSDAKEKFKEKKTRHEPQEDRRQDALTAKVGKNLMKSVLLGTKILRLTTSFFFCDCTLAVMVQPL